MNKPLTREDWLIYLDTTWKKSLSDAWQKEWDDMTREEITRMAKESGGGTTWWPLHTDTLERFAALVAAAEREACAQECETFYNHEAKDCAEAIRARGQE